MPYKESYQRYVNPLREFNKLLSRFESDYEFAIEFFNVDMDKREQWLIDLANESGFINSIRLKRIVKEVRNGIDK